MSVFGFSLLFMISISSGAAQRQSESRDQSEAENLLATLQTLPPDLSTRLDFTTHYFLGRPYLEGGPLGEGPAGEYDQDPLFRMDGFDCTTFVETSLALARARDFPDFLDQLLHIRYLNGQISFMTRNHFVELDWNPNNARAGFIRDLTQNLGTPSDRGLAQKVFNKKTWYENLPPAEIQIPGASAETLNERLNQLHHEGDPYTDVTSFLNYVKKSSLSKLSKQMPEAAVLNIVNHNQVTHQVMLLRVNGQLRIRQASSKENVMHVTDSALEDYAKSLLRTPDAQGVNVMQILPR